VTKPLPDGQSTPTPRSRPESTEVNRRAEVVFWLTAFILVLWRLGSRSFHGSEDRWAEVCREMFLSHDFFHPTINGQPYFDKPLLGYWLVALVSELTGRLNEWSVRLPGAVCGLVALGATVRLGRTLWSPAVGRTAGWLLLTIYGFLGWIMRGEADMENLAAITAATAWYWMRREKRDFLGYFVFYLICFLGAHTKGLAAIAVPAVVLLPDLIRDRRWRLHLNLANFLALGAGLAIYLIPFVYARITSEGYSSSGLALVFKENIERYFDPFDHKEPFYVYFYYIPELFLPWTVLLGAGAICGRTVWTRPYGPTRWLAEAVLLVFLFFTLSGSRRAYYILPILPLCALGTALFLHSDAGGVWKRRALAAQRLGIGLAVAAAFLTPIVLAVLAARRGFSPPREMLIVPPLLGALALVPWWIDRRKGGRLANILGIPRDVAAPMAVTVVLAGGLVGWGAVAVDHYRTRAPFARQLGALLRSEPGATVAFYRPPRAQTLFYAELPVPVRVLKTPEAAGAFLSSTNGLRILVAHQEDAAEALGSVPAEIRQHPALSEPAHPWEERNEKLRVWKISEPIIGPSNKSSTDLP
jgi:4-amino-4-deoxy-L-arabinose transferase-like glycosyltransferase